MTWTDARVERLRELWADNSRSAAEIAAVMCMEFPGWPINRNMVIGKAYRMNLRLRRTVGPVLNGQRKLTVSLPKFPFREPDPAPRQKHVKSYRVSGRARNRIRGPGLDPSKICDADSAAEAGAEKSRCTLLELTANTCRWPVGDPATPQFYFCGVPPAADRPYCPFHCRKAYAPGSSLRDTRSRRYG